MAALDRVRTLLDAYPELNEIKPAWRVTGDTALHVAAFMGDTKLTKLLLGAGCDPRATNNDVQTAKDLLGASELKANEVGEVASNSTPVHVTAAGIEPTHTENSNTHSRPRSSANLRNSFALDSLRSWAVAL